MGTAGRRSSVTKFVALGTLFFTGCTFTDASLTEPVLHVTEGKPVVNEMTFRNSVIPGGGCEIIAFEVQIRQGTEIFNTFGIRYIGHTHNGVSTAPPAGQERYLVTIQPTDVPAFNATNIDVREALRIDVRAGAQSRGGSPDGPSDCKNNVGRKWQFDGVLSHAGEGKYSAEFTKFKEVL